MDIANERESRLPAWARETINMQRSQLAAQAEPLVRELATLRPLVEKLRNKNSALVLLLDCAAKGGHVTSQEIMTELRAHDLVD